MDAAAENGTTIRVDRWLWFARFFKSRNIAAKIVQGRKVRLNSIIVTKASQNVKAGDILTFHQAKDIRVIKILNVGTRRGPAPEAQILYEDLAPKQAKETDPLKQTPKTFEREAGAGRPTKADRRALDKLQQHDDL